MKFNPFYNVLSECCDRRCGVKSNLFSAYFSVNWCSESLFCYFDTLHFLFNLDEGVLCTIFGVALHFRCECRVAASFPLCSY
jgi:hypothetical protein